MNIYLKGRSNSYEAFAIWDGDIVIVKKGSAINKKIQEGYKFANSVIEARNDNEIVSDDFTILKDVKFSSLSTAAQFVTGRSINGKKAWKDHNGILLFKKGVV